MSALPCGGTCYEYLYTYFDRPVLIDPQRKPFRRLLSTCRSLAHLAQIELNYPVFESVGVCDGDEVDVVGCGGDGVTMHLYKQYVPFFSCDV